MPLVAQIEISTAFSSPCDQGFIHVTFLEKSSALASDRIGFVSGRCEKRKRSGNFDD
jgi:hypothetical protein